MPISIGLLLFVIWGRVYTFEKQGFMNFYKNLYKIAQQVRSLTMSQALAATRGNAAKVARSISCCVSKVLLRLYQRWASIFRASYC